MKRWMRKGIGAALAASMLLGSFGSVYAQDTKGGLPITSKAVLIEEAAYDEIYTYGENAVLLENGHWANRTYDWSTGEYKVEKGAVSADTKVVFINGDGNKKVLSNKNGEEILFDAIYPYADYINYSYGVDGLLKVYKEEKFSFIKMDGTFFGTNLTFYSDAYPVSEDVILVSEDEKMDGAGETEDGKNSYCIISEKGEVTVENLTFPETSIKSFIRKIGNCFYISCEDKILIVDKEGNCIQEFSPETEIEYDYDGYARCFTEEGFQLRNEDGEIELELSKGDYSYIGEISDGYICVVENRQTETPDGMVSEKYEKYINIETGEWTLSGKNINEFDEDIVIETDVKGTTSVRATDGTVYINDLEDYMKEAGKKAGYEETAIVPFVSDGYYYMGDSIVFSIMDSTDIRAEGMTCIAYKEGNFKADNVKKIPGYYGESSGEYFITETKNGNLRALCKKDGTIVKDFGKDCKEEDFRSAYNRFQFEDDSILCPIFYTVDRQDDTGEYKYTYLLEDGQMVDNYMGYTDFTSSGNFFKGKEENGAYSVWNRAGKKVYEEKSENEYSSSLKWTDCFYVKNYENNQCELYDNNGNLIFGKGGDYTAIGAVRKSGMVSCYDLKNGLCPVVKEKDGVEKYGLIQIQDIKTEADSDQDMGNEDKEEDGTEIQTASKYAHIVLDDMKQLKAGEKANIKVVLNQDTALNAFEVKVKLNSEKLELVSGEKNPVEFTDNFTRTFSGLTEKNSWTENGTVLLTGASDKGTVIEAGTVIAKIAVLAKEDLELGDWAGLQTTSIFVDETNGVDINLKETGSCRVGEAEDDVILGDVNEDEKIDANDALDILKNAAKMKELTEEQEVAADVTKDGMVDANDALLILKFVAHMVEGF